MGSLDRVKEFVAANRIHAEFREFDESTKNSRLAAQVLGCTVAEIAKSVVFAGGRPSVVVISGDKKVDGAKLSTLVGRDVNVARPDEVRELTGYPIGGVPPFPHLEGVAVFPDRSLTRFTEAWAAAGTPNTVVRLATSDLIRLVGRGTFDLAT